MYPQNNKFILKYIWRNLIFLFKKDRVLYYPILRQFTYYINVTGNNIYK